MLGDYLSLLLYNTAESSGCRPLSMANLTAVHDKKRIVGRWATRERCLAGGRTGMGEAYEPTVGWSNILQ